MYTQVKSFRTLIVDDSPIFLRWLQTTLAGSEVFRIVGQAATGADAITQSLVLEPDLLITDFFLPDMDGIEVVNSLLPLLPKMAVIIVSSHDIEARAAIEILDQTIPFLPKTELTVSALRDLLSGVGGQ